MTIFKKKISKKKVKTSTTIIIVMTVIGGLFTSALDILVVAVNS